MDGNWQRCDWSVEINAQCPKFLGFLAFRAPVPAYKHAAAMFLHLRGWIGSDATHPNSPARPASDRAILREIGRQLNLVMADA